MTPSRKPVSLLLALLAAATAACSREAQEPPRPMEAEPAAVTAERIGADYDCAGGEVIRAVYDPAAQTAQLVYKGRSYALRTAVSASGARYTGEGLEWWTAHRGGGESGTLSRLGPDEDVGTAILERCVLRAAPDGEAPQQAEAAPACRGPQLELRLAGEDAGAGRRVATLAARNLGAQACTLTGYADVGLIDAQGTALSEIRADKELGAYFQPGDRPGPVTLAPQGEAFFDIAWSAVPHDEEGACPQAARVRATAPGDTSVFALDLAIQPCGGRVRVSPFRPVAEASPAG